MPALVYIHHIRLIYLYVKGDISLIGLRKKIWIWFSLLEIFWIRHCTAFGLLYNLSNTWRTWVLYIHPKFKILIIMIYLTDLSSLKKWIIRKLNDRRHLMRVSILSFFLGLIAYGWGSIVWSSIFWLYLGQKLRVRARKLKVRVRRWRWGWGFHTWTGPKLPKNI